MTGSLTSRSTSLAVFALGVVYLVWGAFSVALTTGMVPMRPRRAGGMRARAVAMGIEV